MLDFSFSEIGLVGLVALIAIGPERMPKVARGAGVLFGRFRRYTQSVKAEIDRELQQAELKDLDKKIAEARAEAARQIAASTSAVDQVLNQPVMEVQTVTNPREVSPVSTLVDPVPSNPVLGDADAGNVESSAMNGDAPLVQGVEESLKVGQTLFGGDPFGVRRSAPLRSLSRDPQPMYSTSEPGLGES
ncbi:MAG: twin-arginine translocase subunit TatB [Ferrovum myxofaciens]|uniref:Sec-independent protein translocase protein TatB n=1 Tax=Ferrovum myxofaciens TaxID=416213 RepID=UPI00235331C9|nr:Sec-independent protein translocase protein TatB [Ferrovum myxofaciens]QKE41173.1 MAG: twin-arginine translocase subunit TatB [Ferrovum myxofaciens]